MNVEWNGCPGPGRGWGLGGPKESWVGGVAGEEMPWSEGTHNWEPGGEKGGEKLSKVPGMLDAGAA